MPLDISEQTFYTRKKRYGGTDAAWLRRLWHLEEENRKLKQMVADFSRPGKPTDNAFVESFNGSFRDECLNMNCFLSFYEASAKIEAWRKECNDFRPHSSLGNMTPSDFARTVAVKVA